MHRIIIALFGLMLLSLVSCEKAPPPTSINNQAPDFALKDLDGKEVKLADLISAKPLVLDFWASWCPTCRAELPEVVELYNNYKDRINIVGINLDHTLEGAQRYTKEHNVTYPNLYDEDGKVTGLYQIHGIPAMVIINSKGEIVKRNATIEDVKALIK